MITILKFILILSFSFLPFASFCNDKVLLTINRKDNGQINHLYLKTNNQGQLTNIYLDLPGPLRLYNADNIRNGTGIYFQKGVAIISLKSSDLDVSLGGNIDLYYLREYKIVGDNKYAQIPLKILKDDLGSWALYKGNKKVTKASTYPYTWGIKKFIIE